jgi:hypothetical protein
VGKRTAKKRASSLVSTSGRRRLSPAAIVPAFAVLGAAVWYFFFRGKDGDGGSEGGGDAVE